MPSLNIQPPDTPHQKLSATLMEHGYVVIEELAVETAALAAEQLAPHIEAAPFGTTNFDGARTKSLDGVLQRSVAARELVIHPVVMALCEATLLPYAANFQLNYSGIMHLEPGAPAQDLHRDGLLYPVRHPCPPMILPTMWALSDFTAQNGGTRVVPGSHLWEHEREPFEDEVLSTEMPAGSVLVYTGGTWHGGGENRSDGTRTGMALQYSLGWLRQEETQYLVNPPEIARHYPERLRRLIGYDFGGPYLGFVDGDDPHRIFEPGYSGPRHRSRPEIDAAFEKVDLIRFGDVTPTPTPDRAGRRIQTLQRAPKD
jgi:ectoine hydroxylase-related dioxygenase (phytanoyl-CoA dioxygenase family)